ncbi:tyrosine protein phosphatase [Aliiglaciecola sp. 2_MG-2023]|uniref:tyrosine-protein phosphatase n=1 Tax=unclassified Aliiglaciecola TaxID=2593648 RepID=UPI0026E3C7C2|nr:MULTISPECIES: CpsB/CapC family capsule biosynthesis tyrosine phosphatase [unclassified Aliiglaciecola]MDO6712868.1 tyrosine protein phosphatase [Aliiglaciecola sp. 2_MG-2023]MDO6752896.1 tyrosine protein phosphatase [Aliiglaciecola sp. 1_MG-2023]
MIDIHSHILPGVDDGAKTLAEALDMLKMAVDQGVTTQALTPHIHYGRYENTKADLANRFSQFQQQVADANIDIELRLGAEIRIGTELMQLVQQGQIPWLGAYQGKRTFLLEFPRIEVPHGSDNLVRWLLQKDIIPIIVHPERNKTFIKQPHKLQVFTDMGCPLQITASSLTGKFGDEVKDMAFELVESDRAFAIASDCHNLKGRAPDLKPSIASLQNIIGEARLRSLVLNNPQSLFVNTQTLTPDKNAIC